MVVKRSHKHEAISDTQVDSPVNYDIGKNVFRHSYNEREMALRRLCIRLGMSREDMYRIVGIR